MPKKVEKSKSVDKIKDVDLLKFARKNYYIYGMAVLEDRAIPDFRDGMNPVNRRSLWSAHEMGLRNSSKHVKAARVVGDTLGRFHPHGDISCYSAVVGMTNSNSTVPLIDGAGNWGSMSDGRAAAMRYTELRLSKFSDEVLFNKFYLPVVEKVPNYDGSMTEPLLLPALLPIALLNGRVGIAPGATTDIPIFSSKSLIKALEKIYGGEELTDKLLYKTLSFTTLYGGEEADFDEGDRGKEQKLNRMSVFRKLVGKVRLRSTDTWNPKTNTLSFTKFASISKMQTLLESLNNIEGVSEARDDSTKTDKYGTVTIVLKRDLNDKMRNAIIKHIRDKVMSKNENYVMNFTERYIQEDGQSAAKMKPMSITTMLIEWVKWRTDLERKACSYWIGEAAKQIRKYELLILAVDNRKLIIESLDKDLSQEDLEKWLAKKLGILVTEAAFIYDLKVRQLRRLEKQSLITKKKEVESEKKGLEGRRKTPEPHMLKQLATFTF